MNRFKIIVLGVFALFASSSFGQVTAGDCDDHVNICSDDAFAVDPNGFGAIDELGDGFLTGLISNPSTNPGINGNSGCLLSGETNSTWMVITVSGAGELEFSFGQDDPTGLNFDCYDWIMWPYDPASTCNDILNDMLPPVACNWNGMCEGFTGMANTLPPGADPSNFEAAINVNPGDQFIICFSNYSSATTTVPLTFYQNPNSAAVSCTPIYVNDETICEGECTTLNANGGSNYSWSPTTGLAPTTGATVTACPPSAGTWNYFVSGTTPDGPAGDTATVIVLPSTDPACSTPCAMTNINVNTGPCDPGSTNSVSGTVQFSQPPSSGQLIVEDCQGNQQVFNAPFGTQVNFSFTAQADGSTCAVTAYFTADPACTISVNATYQPPCGCTVDAGTYTVTVDGVPVANDEILCFGETYNIVTNNDFIAPPEATAPPIAAPGQYAPGIGYLLFSCPPTTFPPGQIELDPCFMGVLGYTSFNDPNGFGQASFVGPWTGGDETMYIVPITFYDTTTGTYSYVNTTDACWSMGSVISMQYLSEITFTEAQDCDNGTQTVTISGGLPEMTPGEIYTASNLTPANANFVNNTTTHGGDIVIDGLVDGDVVSFDIVDNNGCPLNITLAPFQGPEDPGFSYPQPAYCSADADPSPNITGDPGTFSSTPGGLVINATTGLIDLDASTPGTYDITYTTNGGITCSADSTVQLTINETPTVDPVADQNVCVGENTTAVVFTGTPAAGVTFDWTSDNTGTGVLANGVNTIPSFVGQNTTGTIAEISTITITPSTAECTGTATTFDIVVNPLPNIDAGPDASICAGGNATLTASGGTVYTWDNGLGVGNGFNVSPAAQTTYVVTGTDANGCVEDDTIVISVGALVPTISPNDTICLGDPGVTITAGGGTTYNWDNGLGAGASHTVSPAVTTTYTVDVSDALCNGQAQVTIVVNPLPNVVADPDITMCIGEDTIVNATGAVNYDWDQTLGNGQSHIVAPVATTTYTVTGTDINGCVNTDQMTVTINPLPPVDAGPDQTVCPTEMVTVNGSGAVNYVWDNGVTDGVAFPAPGAQTTYTVTGTDANGCVNTDDMTVTISTSPPVDAGPDTTMCIGETFNLTATGADTYDWDQGVGIGNNMPVSPATTTQYIVTGTTLSGCVGTDTVVVNINNLPVVDAGPDQTVCEGADVTISGSGAQNYVWDNGVTDGVSFTATTTTTYTVIGTDANGCVETDDMTVTVNIWDDSTFTYDASTYCVTGTNPILTLSGTAGGTFSVTPAGLTLDPVTGAITLATSVNGSYDVTYTTNGMCPTSLTIPITITNTAVADFTYDVYCLNGNDPAPTFINGGTGGVFSSTPGLIINPVTGIVDLDASTPGTYTVTNDINITGCAAVQAQDDITIFDLPTATISGDTTVCLGTHNPTVTFDLPGAGDWTFSYLLDGLQNNVSTTATPYLITNAEGVYELISITDNVTGCSNTISGQVATVILLPIPQMTPIADIVVCEGNDVIVPSFQASVPGTTFDWVNLGTDVGNGMNGNGNMGIFTGINGTTSAQSGNFFVTPTSPNGCTGPVQDFNITVTPLPIIDVTAQINVGCLPVTVVFTNNSSTGSETSFWSFGDGATSTFNGMVSHDYTSDGCFDVTLTMTDSIGCTSTQVYDDIVCLEPNPIANFVFDPSVTDISYTTIQFENLSENATTYYWDFGDNSAINNAENPLHIYGDTPDEYVITLVAENDIGCTDTAISKIVIRDILLYWVPNAFTPDNDEFNQTFKPIFTSGFDPQDYTLLIFNRWGETVFESHNTDVGWDGTYLGNLVQDGVYVWKIEFKETMTDKRHKKYGHVTIMR